MKIQIETLIYFLFFKVFHNTISSSEVREFLEKLENVKSDVGDSAFLHFLDIFFVSNHIQKQITFFANYNTAVISFDDLPLKKETGL